MSEPTWQSEDKSVRLYNTDCREAMRGMGADSIDSIVTDPPYGLSFMGKGWDHGIPGVEFWTEALRVAKPGAHLLAFGGTRTFHRLICAIEDAGWEIRDCIMWVYGSGFPKSLDVSKAIDKAAGAEREVVGRITTGRAATPRHDMRGGNLMKRGERIDLSAITAPATEAATQWEGWGTALKPSWEPIIVARKPLVGTVAANVLQFGTGGINVDGCRVGIESSDLQEMKGRSGGSTDNKVYGGGIGLKDGWEPNGTGRWPANLIHDGSEEVVELFPESAGQQGDTKGTEPSHTGDENTSCYGVYSRIPSIKRGDTGSASRFFYCAKASKEDRGEGNNHPTVKPFELMRYLCKLVTPPGGRVLDLFMGSGSTGKAAVSQWFAFTGIDQNRGYVDIAMKRIQEPFESEKQNLFREQIDAERQQFRQAALFEDEL